MKNKDRNPVYYKSAEEMDKSISVLVNELGNNLAHIRGKLHDIQNSYGWKEQTDYIEGSLTCLIIAMSYTISEMQKFEDAPQRLVASQSGEATSQQLKPKMPRVEDIIDSVVGTQKSMHDQAVVAGINECYRYISRHFGVGITNMVFPALSKR
jgi:hypothetical protein